MTDKLSQTAATSQILARRLRATFARRLRTLTRPGTAREIYLSIAELERRRATPTPGAGALTTHELRCFSQNGEDGVISEILVRISASHGFFVEFGAESGHQGNCVYLADVLGWAGLFIEGDSADYGQLEAKCAGLNGVQTVHAVVTPSNIEQLLRGASVPQEFDVLSIDIDGQDYWLWDAITSYRPRLVVIEYNSALPYDRPLTQPSSPGASWDTTDFYGSSLAALEQLASGKGYRLVHTELTANNAFFVRADLAEGRFPPSSDVPRRSAPNYLLQEGRHVPDPFDRSYLNLDTNQLQSRRAGHAARGNAG